MDSLVDFLLNFYGPTPYFMIVGILLLCGLGLPLPEDVTLFAAGLLSYYGVTQVWIMIAVALVGVLLGDTIIYYLGLSFWPQDHQALVFPQASARRPLGGGPGKVSAAAETR